MNIKIYLRTDEYICDPDSPILFYNGMCAFTDIDGNDHMTSVNNLTGISIIGGSNE